MTRMLSIGEVARMLGGDEKPLDASTIHKWVRKGWLPRQVKIGRLSRWREHEVEAALERLPQKPKAKMSIRATDAKAEPEAAE